ncbi:60 kDa SS-A/Ro ribonucleoprotein-like [Gigantopelta aegis]|uniref:60 kDa SS-A/Ro ribonucleoprotein-like n=1 Tax=Gigantopelta aegis TaxID=1735272 RepID=UPI001B88CF39|nr:60 kDa SS-A/Ro ribonucleoprotein-like [Gigantopelta aegis]XP_041369151.1 60 kDa SS-A/Ro ribonucleoprotein-like [Gigantopelta aegis]
MADEVTLPQTCQISSDQVVNDEGGFVWTVDDMVRVKRFLCLGSEGGTYYSSEQKLTEDNVQCIRRLIADGKGKDVVDVICQFSLEGRTAKQTSILYALAVCVRRGDLDTKQHAYSVLGKICRIPTHLFQFVEVCDKMGETTGWGRAHRKAVSAWYTSFASDPIRLAMHVTKYRKRNDWAHRDLLRLAHTKPSDDAIGLILRYVVKGIHKAKSMYCKNHDEDDDQSPFGKVLAFLEAVEEVRTSSDENRVMDLIKQHRLVREHMPTELLGSVGLWRVLLEQMPLTALIRNLGKMTSIGAIEAGNQQEGQVVKKLSDKTLLKAARIHPFNVLVAFKTYSSGKGDRGKLIWNPTKKIIAALDSAFYLSFKFVEPTNKRYLLAVDVSGSMGCSVLGTRIISCREAAAAMMMVTKRTEEHSEVVAFSHKLTPLNVAQGHTLDAVVKTMCSLPFCATDCSLPMVWAKRNNKKFDVFVVYTDSETYAGAVHPTEALRQYRKQSGVWDARLIVCGMNSNGFTIADPDDPGMMDVVGFDSAAPETMRSFIMGDI